MDHAGPMKEKMKQTGYIYNISNLFTRVRKRICTIIKRVLFGNMYSRDSKDLWDVGK